jgi:16S rRNA (cytosine967-C5)-methyltransferase
MKAFHQLATVQKILESYKQDQPLHRFLAQYYRLNKQMGSKDRKIASRLVYNYFRLGGALSAIPLQEKLAVAEFLCNESSNSFIGYYKEEWAEKLGLPVSAKIAEVEKSYPQFQLADVFPFNAHLLDGIDSEDFLRSFFIQPDLFVRVKKGGEKQFQKLLSGHDIPFKQLGEQTFALANGTKLEVVIPDKGIYEVQDRSSQETGTFFKPNKWDKWWDCCAASGGKSLMLHDQQPDIKLLVTDIRESILANLDERFRNAGIRNYQKKVMDLTLSQSLLLHDYHFDGIIVDAPCSGSGTWGRTPEMISQFQEHSINFFQELQRKILKNVIQYLKNDKPLIYITCSVFKEENEEQVQWLQKEFSLEVESQKVIKGYQHKADTMFVARLVKK